MTAIVAMLSLLCVPIASTAFAGKQSLDSILTESGLSWGMTRDQVITALRKQFDAKMVAETKGVDDIARRDKIRKSYDDRFKLIEESYLELAAGERSGLEVSIVGDQFVTGNNESVLTSIEEVATKYYFFIDNQLYKIAVTYDPAYIGGLAFDTFAAKTNEKYGSPDSEDLDEEGFFVGAMWKDKKGNRLRILDRSLHYNSFLMTFSSIELEAPLVEKHAAAAASRKAGPAVSSDIESLTEGEDTVADGSAVDDILGTSTKVDLLAGLPQEEIDAMNETEEEKKKKKKEKKKKTRKKKDDGKTGSSGAGIVIY
ncbi:MAG: hypothetical protein RBU37_12560 [Myxococcota bacterium]|jgi:hypothetical protein|nr:hypothetical protein [Myxococcota bacterium]